MPTKLAMILSWEFYSDWYHMHDESSLIWVAFYVVIELHFVLLLSCIYVVFEYDVELNMLLPNAWYDVGD